MNRMLFFGTFLFVAVVPVLVEGVKIAFVGDTGMEDKANNGYGDLTLQMIEDEGVDLVVDVGDFDYWGRCTETYEVVLNHTTIDSLTGDDVDVSKKSKLKRIKWQDGRHGSIKGWEIGVQASTSVDDVSIQKTKSLTLDGDLYERHVIKEKTWEKLVANLKLKKGPRNCDGWPWDGPWEWNQYLRDFSFDFLGASGNAEVKEAPLYGSAEIWSAHQEYLHKLYLERIYSSGRGACHGYSDQTEPGTIDEYGERFSCYYNNKNGDEDFQFLFLGWWQGSDEGNNVASREERKKTISFINREFSNGRSQKVKWRFCIQHMTSAKLSTGEKNRNNMVLAGITDACRKHGAIIISGHHHHYSRTKMLTTVGNQQGDSPIPITDSSKLVISEGRTISITAGMGGYDGACNGMHANATWMEKCIARPNDHRGAVIAVFDESDPARGTFQYMNSMKEGEIVDEFQITSELPGAITGTGAPTDKQTQKPTGDPTDKQTQKPTGKPTDKQTQKPTSKPTTKPKPTHSKSCRSALEMICDVFNILSDYCTMIHKYGLTDLFTPSENDKPLTVFVPNNTAFEALKGDKVFGFDPQKIEFDSLTRDETIFVLLNHAIVDEDIALSYSNLECKQLTRTANGEDIRTRCDNKNLKYQKGPSNTDDTLSRIVIPNMSVCNGVVHVVSNVLLPNLLRMD